MTEYYTFSIISVLAKLKENEMNCNVRSDKLDSSISQVKLEISEKVFLSCTSKAETSKTYAKINSNNSLYRNNFDEFNFQNKNLIYWSLLSRVIANKLHSAMIWSIFE